MKYKDTILYYVRHDTSVSCLSLCTKAAERMIEYLTDREAGPMSRYSEYIDRRNEHRKFYMRAKWRRTREQVLKRDHYECVQCRAEGRLTINQKQSLEVDHIKELETHPESAYDLDNLQTLCKYHHNKKHGRFEFNPNHKQKKYNDEKW